ncbi:hypothetical protein [Chromobacterium sp. IIBBL 290-4]|uniref:hypothetical protein n=1 Tax=Chromobacterium sp. IIBBL 290-4 TaxID=2953890 RepID=UPI0020B64AC4|nr:hypothetical protein [Chromobacterium sp. IIBBL 290-4]UTH72404.1 hypothetical protein NKT35_12665 [Chromobacterium sp. IIBBL 290-4]
MKLGLLIWALLSAGCAVAACMPRAIMCASPRDAEVKRQDLTPQGIDLGPFRLEQDPESHALRLAPALDLGKHTHLSVKMHNKDVGLKLKFNTD